MKNFPIKVNDKEYWISRAVAVVGFVFCYDHELLVLANQRGPGTPDFQGYWNCPCGYLDFDETTAEACSREIAEETNLYVNPKALILIGINDDPKEPRQNVTLRYYTFSSQFYKSQTIYAKGAEEDEVAEVDWISINDIDNYQWAFGHDKLIKQVVLDKLSDWISPELRLKLIADLKD
jgi:ADP-ribose pyrophosphatase YjhB (NUDIX family)